MDYYLRANNKQELWNALLEAGAAVSYAIKDSEGNIIETNYTAAPGYTIDVIGTIYKPTGNVIRQTVEDRTVDILETAELEGFHANLRGPADLAPNVEYIQYQPTAEEMSDPGFVMPAPERKETPSPLASLLVYPSTPMRVWF